MSHSGHLSVGLASIDAVGADNKVRETQQVQIVDTQTARVIRTYEMPTDTPSYKLWSTSQGIERVADGQYRLLGISQLYLIANRQLLQLDLRANPLGQAKAISSAAVCEIDSTDRLIFGGGSDQGWLEVTGPGKDGKCNSADDEDLLIRSGGAANDPSLNVTQLGLRVIDTLSNADGSETLGILVLNTGTGVLSMYDRNLKGPMYALATPGGAADVTVVDLFAAAPHMPLVRVNKQYFVGSMVNGQLSLGSALLTQTDSLYDHPSASDADALYLVDGHVVHAFHADGSVTQVATLDTMLGVASDVQVIHGHVVVQQEKSLPDGRMQITFQAHPTDRSAPRTLTQLTAGVFAYTLGVQDNKLLVASTDYGTHGTDLLSIGLDGNVSTLLSQINLVDITFDQLIHYNGANFGQVIFCMAHDMSNNCNGQTLQSYQLATGSLTDLGALPSLDADSSVFARSMAALAVSNQPSLVQVEQQWNETLASKVTVSRRTHTLWVYEPGVAGSLKVAAMP